jgi:hypothetical protein
MPLIASKLPAQDDAYVHKRIPRRTENAPVLQDPAGNDQLPIAR